MKTRYTVMLFWFELKFLDELLVVLEGPGIIVDEEFDRYIRCSRSIPFQQWYGDERDTKGLIEHP